MERKPDSHKGENGRVAIVGGSAHIHGAPILSLLAAEASGVDLLTIFLPKCHAEVAKQHCLNCFVHPFDGNDIAPRDVADILQELATMDAAVIGPGIAKSPQQIAVLMSIIAEASCPLVLDATALQQETLTHIAGKDCILTPHLGELERMGLTTDALPNIARELGCTVCLKGSEDTIVSSDGTVQTVRGGNAGLTVGGTGDVLAGLIAGCIAQGAPAASAVLETLTVLKNVGEQLFEEVGYSYTARDVLAKLPRALRTLHT